MVGTSIDERIDGFEESIPVHGQFDLIHWRNGREIFRAVEKNLVVNTGKTQIPKLVNGLSSAFFNYIQIGLATNTPSLEDTHLYSPYMEGLATCSYGTDYKAIFDYVFTFTENQTITEAGVFNGSYGAVPAPIMLCRGTFAGRPVEPLDNLEVKWRTTFG
jgi:hypothetical protein